MSLRLRHSWGGRDHPFHLIFSTAHHANSRPPCALRMFTPTLCIAHAPIAFSHLFPGRTGPPPTQKCTLPSPILQVHPWLPLKHTLTPFPPCRRIHGCPPPLKQTPPLLPPAAGASLGANVEVGSLVSWTNLLALQPLLKLLPTLARYACVRVSASVSASVCVCVCVCV